jgi:hypothetical protein
LASSYQIDDDLMAEQPGRVGTFLTGSSPRYQQQTLQFVALTATRASIFN